jgi:outer membrane protein OmpA-like peptidoglycan-associated protein
MIRSFFLLASVFLLPSCSTITSSIFDCCGDKVSAQMETEESIGPVAEAQPAPAPSFAARELAKTDVESIRFGSNKVALDASAKEALSKQLPALRASKGKILASSYCNSDTSAEVNEKVGKLRAQSVVDFLVENGIDADRIEVENNGAKGGDRRAVDLTLVSEQG